MIDINKLDWLEVESSNIHSIAHEEDTLFVKFLSGAIYKYFHVPKEVYEDMLKAPSYGVYLNKSVKPNYSYQRLDR